MNPFIDLAYGPALERLADLHGGREALVFGGRRWTFLDAKAEIDAASARFAGLGLRPGDHIAIWLPNRPEFIWCWLGATQAGFVPVILNTRLTEEEAAYQIAQSDSRAIVIPGDGAFRDFAGDLLRIAPELAACGLGQLESKRLPALRHVLACDSLSRPVPGIRERFLDPGGPMASVRLVEDWRAPGMIVYTSGTTALPKGAVLNQAGFRKAWDHGPRLKLTEQDRLYLTVPLFGILASLNGVLTFWTRGAAVVLVDRFEAGQAIASIEAERCTAAYLFPPMVEQILAHPDWANGRLTSLRTGLVASNDPGIQRRAIEQLGMRDLITSYGMTETSSACTRTHAEDSLDVKLETQGAALPDIEVQIADPETGVVLQPGAEGEILVRGYNVMLEYYNKPQETAAAIRPDGFFRTGDLGVLSPEGRLSFRRRIKDGYKHKGFNVATAEVEAALAQHPAVAAAAVVGVPDGANGEVGMAFVILRPGAALDEPALLGFLSQRLARFKLPAGILAVPEFPLTAGTAKVKKGELRTRAIASRAG